MTPSQPSSSDAISEHATADDRHLSAYTYDLPEEAIAQEPVSPRDSSRLLALTSPTEHQHRIFRDLPTLLRPDDLLVMNNTRVIPARIYGRKPSGAEVEVLLIEEQQRNQWLALVKPGRRLKPGADIEFPNPDDSEVPITAKVLSTDAETSGRVLQFSPPDGGDVWNVLPRLGQVPLPPYVTNTTIDAERYQTVYGEQLGAIAAPTAGLHFTPELLQTLQAMGVNHTFITLHVGVGTFRPVEREDITAHEMHSEWIDVPQQTVDQIRQTQEQGGRIIAVGTTAVRALEGAAQSHELTAMRGKTNLFIYPGYRWQVVDGLITNFHLPKSSLLMLVSALIGRQRLLQLYEEAIAHHYRFYSFGDAMIVLPEAVLSDARGQGVSSGVT